MSIQSRVHEAESFWSENRKEEALLAVLSAAYDTARRRFPQAKEKEGLAAFVGEAAGQLVEGGVDPFDWTFRGGISLGEVLYDVYRCLLKTKKLPADVELVPGNSFAVHILQGNRRAYSDCLILRLIEIVKRAPENAREFSKRK